MRIVMTGLLFVLGGVIVLAGGLWLYIQLAPSDPARWHVDPMTVERPGFSGYYLMRPPDGPVFDMTPEQLLQAFDEVAMAAPRVTRLAGSPQEGLVTYVARSALWRFPDYVSVRAVPAEGDGGARLAVFSRLRFGADDMGVNRGRIEAWTRALGTGGA